MYWGKTEHNIPHAEYKRHYIQVLKEALDDGYDYDIRRTEVYEALDWLEKNTPSTWGITLFRQGLEIKDWNERAHYLREGYFQIQRFIAT